MSDDALDRRTATDRTASRTPRSHAVADEGAEDRLRTLVFEFYARVRDDDLLGPVFEERLTGRWDAHLERMCDFWSTVLHASGRYRGDPVASHARLPGLAPRHFDRWLDLFDETAHDVLPAAEADDIVARSRRMRAVLGRSVEVRTGGGCHGNGPSRGERATRQETIRAGRPSEPDVTTKEHSR